MQILKECNLVIKVKNFIKPLSTLFINQYHKVEYSWTHVREIPGTKLLVSLHHSCYDSANLAVFDLTYKGKVNQIYSFEEVHGSN